MRRILLPLIAAGIIAFSGCQSRNKEMTGQEKISRQKLQSAPFAVTEGFLRDFPNATITSANAYTDSTGRTLYRVNYIRSSKTGTAIYTAQGQQVTPPMAWLE